MVCGELKFKSRELRDVADEDAGKVHNVESEEDDADEHLDVGSTPVRIAADCMALRGIALATSACAFGTASKFALF